MVAKKSDLKGFFEMNIRVGSPEHLLANTPVQTIIADPVVLKSMQEMALASINGINIIHNNLRWIHKDSLQYL